MKGSLASFVLACLLFPGLGARADLGSSNAIVRIEIDSAWAGLGQPRETKVEILRTPDGYRRDGAIVPEKAVNELIAAIWKPALDQPTLANLGIDRAWLDARSTPDTTRTSRLMGRSATQLALFKARFGDAKIIARLVAGIYSPESFHTDDYPRLTVAVSFANGSTTVLDTLSQHAFMLPWTITVKGGESITYDANVSRAVFALLPPTATNAGRVSGATLAEELSDAMLDEIDDDWNMLDAQSRAPASIALLKPVYDVRTAKISDRNSINYFAEAGTMSGDVFDATLSRRRFPKNLQVALELPFDNGRAEGVERFLTTNPARENLVLSITWLMRALRRHADVRAQLVYVHGASLSESALAAFRADMHALGKDRLAAEVAAVRERSALLMTGDPSETAWIVLPDRRMVLWHYRGDESLLDWKPSSFSVRPCKTFFFTFFDDGGCIGAVISASGAIER